MGHWFQRNSHSSQPSSHVSDQPGRSGQVEFSKLFGSQDESETGIELTCEGGESLFADINGVIARNGKFLANQVDQVRVVRVQPEVQDGMVKVVEITNGYDLRVMRH